MKGYVDKPSYIIELLEGGVTLEDVIDGHICEQSLVRPAPPPKKKKKSREMLQIAFYDLSSQTAACARQADVK